MSLDVVQAAYRLELDERAWLTGIMRAIRPNIDGGMGVGGVIFDAADPNHLRVSRPIVLGASPLLEAGFAATFRMLRPSDVERTFRAPVWFTTTSDVLGPGQRFLRNSMARILAHPFGVVDLIAFKASRPSHSGVLVAAALPSIRSVSSRDSLRWAYTAAHVAAAHRLRSRLEDPSLTEAILTPDGATVHAEDAAKPRSARDALREAAVRMARARRAERNDPDALEAWTALVEGRWSLIDHFDSDGKRFLIVRKNDPKLPDPRTLTLRERQVVAYVALGRSNKLIAYEMGLAPSTVAEHLKSALDKLGMESRAELARSLQGDAGNPNK